MYFSRLKNKSRRLVTLLVGGLLLRSLIAPGYMLNTSSGGDLWLSLELCAGAVSAIAGHADKPDHQEPQTGKPLGHGSEDRRFSACDLWSASSPSLLLYFDLPLFPAERFPAALISYKNRSLPRYSDNTALARAPPVLG